MVIIFFTTKRQFKCICGMRTYSHVTPNHLAIVLLLAKTNLNGFPMLGIIVVTGESNVGSGIIGETIVDVDIPTVNVEED
jgi:hypothetical protein